MMANSLLEPQHSKGGPKGPPFSYSTSSICTPQSRQRMFTALVARTLLPQIGHWYFREPLFFTGAPFPPDAPPVVLRPPENSSRDMWISSQPYSMMKSHSSGVGLVRLHPIRESYPMSRSRLTAASRNFLLW